MVLAFARRNNAEAAVWFPPGAKRPAVQGGASTLEIRPHLNTL